MTITYNGTTAGATSTNPPVVIASALGGKITNAPGVTGGKLWFYQSTNAATDISGAASSITDAKRLGMTEGDVLMGVYSTAAGSTVSILYFGVIAAVTTAGAAISTNVITSTMQ